MKRPLAVLSILAAATLGLAACSGGGATSDSSAPGSTGVSPQPSTPETTPAAQAADSSIVPCNDPSCDPNKGLFPVDGKYEFWSEYDAKGSFEFDSTPDADVEKLRKASGDNKETHYMTIKVDNRAGGEHANMYAVTAYDPDGKKYEYTGLSEQISEWGPTLTMNEKYLLPDGTAITEAEYDELNSLGVDLHNKYLDGIDVSEAGPVTLVFQGKLPEAGFTRVNVEAHGMSEGTDAYLEGQEPPAMDGGDVFASQTMDECITNLAEINAEVDGVTAESLMDDPAIEETCVGILATQGGN